MKNINLRLWYVSFALKGLLATVVSGSLLFFLDVPDVVDTFWDYTYLLILLAFYAGLLMFLMSLWQYFFGSSGVPNYVYRPEKQSIFVRYSTCPFKIERNGIQIWVGMVLDAQLRHRQITLQGSNSDYFVSKDYFTGREDDNLFFTADGQKLHLTRKIFGIKVWWDEENDPWKIVER